MPFDVKRVFAFVFREFLDKTCDELLAYTVSIVRLPTRGALLAYTLNEEAAVLPTGLSSLNEVRVPTLVPFF